jgi:methylmalonyl-CoA/ethylmalonyl-CoA epimerase
MIIRMSHVGVAVKDLEKTLKLYEDVLGLRPEVVKDMGRSRLAFIPVGDDEIELIQPSGDDSMLSNFIKERGEMVHHIALETDDIEATMEHVKSRGATMLDEEPIVGAHGVRIAFFTLEGQEDVAFELVESKSSEH